MNGAKNAGSMLGRRGKKHPMFKRGWYIDQDGYRMALATGHPFQRRHHYIREHIMVMELHIGRRIAPNECVHHKNKIRTDNRLSNLELMKKGEHSRRHRAGN